uniref:PDZ domain-containing protein n=1 Tax=Zooxanthella nutricula TaxID=1333877 RepID=A0A7S2LZY3_9DINO
MGAASCAMEPCEAGACLDQQLDVANTSVGVCAEDGRVRVEVAAAAPGGPAEKRACQHGERVGGQAQTLLQSRRLFGEAKVLESSDAQLPQRGTSAADRTFEFGIRKLVRGEKLGVDVRHDNGVLTVASIFADGAVARINAAARARNPRGEFLQVGDVIERVNRVAGDDDAMVAECLASAWPMLCVRRHTSGPAKCDVASAGAFC